MTLKDELHRSVDAPGEDWRKNFRNYEETEPKQKECPVLDVTGDESKIKCCKEQYFIGTSNVSSMNQGKFEVVKQEMARVNIDILRIKNMQATPAAHFQKNKQLNQKMGQRTKQTFLQRRHTDG